MKRLIILCLLSTTAFADSTASKPDFTNSCEMAITTSLSVAQGITHRALNLQQSSSETSDDDLPSLHINTFSNEELDEIRKTSEMSDIQLAVYEQEKGLTDDGAIE